MKTLITRFSDLFASLNPFVGTSFSDSYGITAEQLYMYFMRILPHTPVFNSTTEVIGQIESVYTANHDLYDRVYKAMQELDAVPATDDASYTDDTTRSGHDDYKKEGTTTNSNARTGNDSTTASGEDSTLYDSGTTVSQVTYDDKNMTDTNKSKNGGKDTYNYGKTDTTNYNSTFTNTESFVGRKDTTEYNSNVNRKVSGRTGNPSENVDKRLEVSRNNRLFLMIVNDILTTISCIILPPMNFWQEDNEIEI